MSYAWGWGHEDKSSMSGHLAWDIWRAKWHWDMNLSQYFSFPCQYHSTDAPYSFIHLPPTLCNVSLQVLQFSPVSIILPMFHTHSHIYHQRYIMFLSQYFSFPCQYHSTNAPYSFIHLPPTLYNVSFPVLQFPLSASFHQWSILIHSPTTTVQAQQWTELLNNTF
jgi:hypothetical protein